MKNRVSKVFPHYHGRHWIQARLPESCQPWIQGRKKSIRQRNGTHQKTCDQLAQIINNHDWKWPKHPVFFITDIHADTDALIASLVASGGIKKTGPQDKDFKLTRAGRHARFVIGGDCFDKGPSNLRLLRMLKRLRHRGADLRLLAGNHDIRVMLGMRSVGKYRNHENEHFFIRMGPKAIPLIREITDQYISKKELKQLPSNMECRKLLYPSEQWFDHFPVMAKDYLTNSAMERELEKIQKKIARFEEHCKSAGLSMRQVYAATLKWQELFLQPGGEFYWFYDRMRLFFRQGSFLFIHAGLDDEVADLISRKGVKHLNRRFKKHLNNNRLSFYYGPIANSIRTKYRAADHPLTRRGAKIAHETGVHVIIHGHRNVYHGQRISLRKNLVNFECDTTMDSGSRAKEGLKGAGAGVTIIHPSKLILGISSDHEHAKVFDPEQLCA